MKNFLITIILSCFIIFGILLILYPFLGKYFYRKKQTKNVEEYKQNVIEMSEEQKKEIIANYTEYTDILGYIEIPTINVFLPIYPNTEDKNLLKGIGVFNNTPLPSNNKAYHCVLAGHTGITAKIIFDNLNKLVKGDIFYVDILNEKFKYEVCNIQTVLPDETQSLVTKENDKLVTLVTCTPKYVNSHRLLVTGKFVK